LTVDAQPWADAVLVPVRDVSPNPWNPNRVPDHVMHGLVENVRRLGFVAPILVRRSPEAPRMFEVVDGEHRWRAALAAGLERVPVVIRDLTDVEAKAQTLALNKLRGEMEPAEVARIVAEVEEAGIDLTEFAGYTPEELVDLHQLAAFEWQPPADPAVDRGKLRNDDEWVTLKFRVPASIADVVNAELDRLLTVLGYEGQEAMAHMALEVMAVNSSHVPEGELT
jgi:ParB-like chromosome segregation protein Spo0J